MRRSLTMTYMACSVALAALTAWLCLRIPALGYAPVCLALASVCCAVCAALSATIDQPEGRRHE